MTGHLFCMQGELHSKSETAAAVEPCPSAQPGQGMRFRSPQHEAIYTILRSATELRDNLGRILAPFDLTPEQYNILRIVRGAGEGGLCVHQIGQRMTTRVPAMTRLLDKMEAKGLICREREAADRRQINCSLSPQGRELLAQLDSRMDAADAASMAELSSAEVAQLIALLGRARQAWQGRNACTEAPEPAPT